MLSLESLPSFLLPLLTMYVISVVSRTFLRRALCHADATSKPLIVFVNSSAARMYAAGHLAMPVVLLAMLPPIIAPTVRLSHQPLEVVVLVDCRLVSAGAMRLAIGIRTLMRALPDASYGFASSGLSAVRWAAPASATEAHALVAEDCGDGGQDSGSPPASIRLMGPLREFGGWGVRRSMVVLVDPVTTVPDLDEAAAEVRRLKVGVVVVQVGGEWRKEFWPLLSPGVSGYVPPTLDSVPSLMVDAAEAIGKYSLDVGKPFILVALMMSLVVFRYEESLTKHATGAIRSLVLRSVLLPRLPTIEPAPSGPSSQDP